MAYSFFMVSGDRKVQFPIAPSDLTISVNGRNETIDLMNEGEVNLLKSPGLTEISFTAIIPQVGKYPFAVNDEPIDTYVNFLNDMLTGKKSFRFVVVRTAGTKLLFDTNIQVSCEGYEMKESAENGFDIELEISLKQYREYSTKTITLVATKTTNTVDTTVKTTTSTTKKTTTNVTTTKASTSTTAKTNSNRDTKSSSGTKYYVQSGDCLYSIAKKFYGNGNKWTTIYNANKTVIENTAKKAGRKSSENGHWIYTGTPLIIP